MGAPPEGLTLALDASTAIGTVAVLSGARVLAEGETRMRGEAGERLLPTIELALRQAGVVIDDVTDIVCGNGPGSFTSLRIAAGIAKGLCHARELPLRSVSSLVLVAAAHRPALAAGRYLATIDAMRGERFALEITVREEGAFVAGAMARLPVAAIEQRIAHEELRVLDGSSDAAPHARGVALLRARRADALIQPVALDGWEPDYGRLAEAQVKWEAAHGRALA